MCLISFAFGIHPANPLVLIGNRDEFYERPTAALHWWNEPGINVLAGRDMKEGGTWMGINEKGDFAALTNYRHPVHMIEGRPSRGHLLRDFLNGTLPLEEFHRRLLSQGAQYNGFNIIYGSREELYYFNNIDPKVRQLYPGIYGLSNALLDTPWPKVHQAKQTLRTHLQAADIEDKLITAFHNDTEAPDDKLPATGVSPEWEKKLSAMFITSASYGTRLTTFVSVDTKGNVVYREKGYVPGSDTRFTFAIQ